MFKKTVMGLVVISANMSWASDAQKPVDEEMIVTATRTEQPLFKSLASVSVITEEDIQKIQAQDVVGVLATVPGLDVRRTGGRNSRSAISLRGTESDHVLVLVDGVRIGSSTTGEATLQYLPVDQIERIEVVKGPRSSLYGAEAIGGVIQVFTKKGREGVQSSVSTEIGSNNLRKSSMSLRGISGNTGYSLIATHEETDGYDHTVKSGTQDDDSDAFRQTSWAASIEHSFDSGAMIGVSLSRADGDSEFDGTASNDYVESVIENRNAKLVLPIMESVTARFEVGRSRDKQETFASYTSLFETTRDYRSAQVDIQLTENQLTTVGYDYYNDEVDSSTDFTEDERDNEAYFIQHQGSFRNFKFSASYRKDDNEFYGENNTRSISVGYSLTDDTIVSLSYGTAFKAPTFNDLYYPFESNVFLGTIYHYTGNPLLTPEESETWELMAKGRADDLSWFASIYKTKVDDLIELTTVALSPTEYLSAVDNISKAEILGGETGVEFNVFAWNVNASLSYTDPRNETTDDMLPNRARGKAKIDLTKQFGSVELIVAWQAQSHRFNTKKERMGGYNTVDVRATYQVTPKLVLAANVANLFDKHYRYDRQYENPGRTASVSARYSF